MRTIFTLGGYDGILVDASGRKYKVNSIKEAMGVFTEENLRKEIQNHFIQKETKNSLQKL